MTDHQKQELLQTEYFHLHDSIERFDERALTIKGWSVTVGMIGIAAAFMEKIPALLLLSALASLLFWLIEGLWKAFQQAHYRRIRQIELYLAGEWPAQKKFHAPNITGSWHYSWTHNKSGTLWRILFGRPHVYLPHAVVVAGGVLLWGLHQIYPIVH